MRDVVAGLVAIALLLAAASLGTTLTAYRRRRQRARDLDRTRGRTIVAELPTADELVTVSEDSQHFYYGDRSIDKASIFGVRLLINGAPLAVHTSRRRLVGPFEVAAGSSTAQVISDVVEGIARDRWDVAIETSAGTTLVECGSVRERVSQELARAVFEAIKRDLESRDHSST